MADASQTLCSCCQRHPPLAGAPFCTGCLLTQGGVDPLRPPTGAHFRHLPAGTAVGPYEIAELLGEGGFAEVYSAVRPGQAGPIAFKVIKRGMDSRDILARFRAEQRTIQSLSHPQIVEPLDNGFTAEGLPWFAMAQVDGLPVTDYCEVAALSLPDRLRLFLSISDAVQHAHQKGILHRDLKPSNLLVEETPNGPVPKIIDFGIAKALEPGGAGHTHVTQLGHVVGTPAYMSPEQAAGSDGADTRSDIYSLGAVLYETLAGGPPFDTGALQRLPAGEWSRFLREHPPAPLSEQPGVAGRLAGKTKGARGDLDQILRKAMAPDPDARYASADAFAEDVRRWLDDRPVSARPPTFGELTRRYLRRHRWPVALAVAVLGGIIATAGIGTVLAIQARKAEAGALREKNRALIAEHRAEDAREYSEHQNYQTAIDLAAIHLQRGEPHLAAERLRATPERLRGWEWGHLMAAVPPPEASADSGLDNPGVLAASPDGATAAVAAGNQLRIVDLHGNRVIGQRTFRGNLTHLKVSGDGSRVAAIESLPEGNVLHAARVDGSESWSTPLSSASDIAWEPAATGGALLLVCGNGPTPSPGRLARFDPSTGRVLNERPFTRWKIHGHSLAVGPAGRMAVAENSYNDLEIFSLPGLQTLSTNEDEAGVGVDDFDLDDVRDRLVVGRGRNIYAGPATRPASRLVGTLTAARSSGTEEAADAAPKSSQVRRLNFLPDGHWLAVGDALLLAEGGLVKALPAPGAHALFSLNGGRVLALLASGGLEIRPELPPAVSASATEGFFGGEYPEGRGIVFTPDSRHVAFQSWQRDRLEYVGIGKSNTGATPVPAAEFARQPAAEWSVLPAAGPDGSVLTRNGDGLVAVRQNGDRFEQTALPQTGEAWSACAFADGSRLAVGVPTGVRLLDWKTRAVVREWNLPGGPFSVFVVGNGSLAQPAVVAIGKDSTLHYLPVAGASVAIAMPFRANGYYPAPLAFDAKHSWLAGALPDGGFAVYDIGGLPAPPRLLRRTEFVPVVTALAFAPSARRLAVAIDDHRLTLWDWAPALPLMDFPLNSTCAGIAFSDDGEWMANTDYHPSLVVRRAAPRSPGR